MIERIQVIMHNDEIDSSHNIRLQKHVLDRVSHKDN